MMPSADSPIPVGGVKLLSRRMRAALLYGAEDIRMEDVRIPRPGPGEVLARVDVASVDFTDRKVYLRGHHPMITIPGLFGHEWAGTIVEVGAGAEGRWKPGQRVAAANSAPCQREEGPLCRQCLRGRPSMCETIQYLNGAFAPYILVPRRLAGVNLHPVPDGIPPEQVVFTEPYACAVQAVRRMPLLPGDVVVVLGAGPMGLFMVNALRRRYGKDCVIVSLDRLDSRLRVAEFMGATHALNTTDRSSGDALQAAIGRPTADVVIEVIGTVETHREALGLVGRGGTLLSFGGVTPGQTMPVDMGHLHYQEIAIQPIYHHTPVDVAEAVRQLVAGEVPVHHLITAQLPMSDLATALQMVANRTTLRTILIPDQR
jgi:L-iditol 2-dehydrogenase